MDYRVIAHMGCEARPDQDSRIARRHAITKLVPGVAVARGQFLQLTPLSVGSLDKGIGCARRAGFIARANNCEAVTQGDTKTEAIPGDAISRGQLLRLLPFATPRV